MNSGLEKIFAYGETIIRVVGSPVDPRFVAIDICRALGIGQATRAVENFDETEKGMNLVHTPGGIQEMLVVTEPGLYRLIFRSDKPAAKPFQDWVFREVLPSIRLTGGYAINDPSRLWEAFEQAKTGKVQLALLAALGIGAPAARTALGMEVNVEEFWYRVLNGVRAQKFESCFRLRKRFDAWHLFFRAQPIVDKLGDIDRRDLLASLACGDDWIAGKHRQRFVQGIAGGELCYAIRVALNSKNQTLRELCEFLEVVEGVKLS